LYKIQQWGFKTTPFKIEGCDSMQNYIEVTISDRYVYKNGVKSIASILKSIIMQSKKIYCMLHKQKFLNKAKKSVYKLINQFKNCTVYDEKPLQLR
jgi:hypothetical protein